MQLTNCPNSVGFQLPSQPRFTLLQQVLVATPTDKGWACEHGYITGLAFEENEWRYQITYPNGVTSSPWMPRGCSDWASEDELWVR